MVNSIAVLDVGVKAENHKYFAISCWNCVIENLLTSELTVSDDLPRLDFQLPNYRLLPFRNFFFPNRKNAAPVP
jgi:hypothetical protein